jgi:outer membrane lipase/esterase
MIAWHIVTSRQGRSVSGMRIGHMYRRHSCQRRDIPTRYAVLLTMLMMGLSLVVSVQAQPLSIIPGLTPPEQASGQAIDRLCPRLDPNVTTGGVGDLQIRCTEMIGNAPTNPSAARTPLLPLAPEEIVAQGKSAVETSNRNIGARLATLHGGVTSLGLRRFTLWNEEPTAPYTLVASLAPFAAVNSVVAASTPSPFSRLGVFANGTFTGGDKDATSREAGFDFKTYGATLGADYRFTNNFVLGVTFNYQSTNIDFDNSSFLNTPDGGGIDTHSFGFSIYGTYYVSNQFYVDGIFNFGRNHYDIDRRIIYSIPSTNRAGEITGGTTLVNQTAQGDTNSTQYSFSVGAGYDFNVRGFTITPFVRLEYSRLDVSGYQESIDNTANGFGLALAFDDQNVESLLHVLGVQASYAISTGIGVLLPQVRAEWRHEFKNDARTITSRFVFDPLRTPLALVTDSPDRDFFALGVSLSATFRGGVAAFVSYEPVIGLADVTSHSVVGGIRFEF